MLSTEYDSEKKIWFGKHCPPFYHESVSVGKALYNALSRDYSMIAQISENNGISFTNGEILDQMITIAGNLKTSGAQKDTVITITALNGHLVVPTIFAGFLLGIPVNTLDPNYTVEEKIHMLRLIRPGFIFCDGNIYKDIQQAISVVGITPKVITYNQRRSHAQFIDDYLVKTGKEASLEVSNVEASTCALIVCSSGTTGTSKAISISHQHLLYEFGYPTFKPCEKDSRVLIFSSFSWVLGIGRLVQTTIQGIPRIITTNKFSPELFFEIVKKHKPTHFNSSPFELMAILDHDSFHPTCFSSFREYLIPGSAVTEGVWKKLKSYISNGFVAIGYGTTETGGVAFQLPNTSKFSVGRLKPDVKLKILTHNGDHCESGRCGELYVKPKFSFLGYYGNEITTKQAVTSDGWIHTGDVGLMDADGDLHIIDRVKDIINYNGNTIFPLEIEQIILSHSDVKHVAVVGIPDQRKAQVPTAVVIRKDGATVTEENIKNLVACKLPQVKHLRGGVFFVDKFPLTSTGKLLKRKLREMVVKTSGIIYRE